MDWDVDLGDSSVCSYNYITGCFSHFNLLKSKPLVHELSSVVIKFDNKKQALNMEVAGFRYAEKM